MPTMKELREECAKLGITPGRSIEETQRRIKFMQEDPDARAPLPALDAALQPVADVAEGLVAVVSPVPAGATRTVSGEGFHISEDGSEVMYRSNAAGHYDVVPDQVPTDDRRRNVVHLAPAAKDKAAQHRLARKQMRKATQRAQRRRAA